MPWVFLPAFHGLVLTLELTFGEPWIVRVEHKIKILRPGSQFELFQDVLNIILRAGDIKRFTIFAKFNVIARFNAVFVLQDIL